MHGLAWLALMARDQDTPRLAGQILLSPMLDACLGTCSLREVDAGPVGCHWADGWAQYLGTPDKAAHPYAAPVNASRLERSHSASSTPCSHAALRGSASGRLAPACCSSCRAKSRRNSAASINGGEASGFKSLSDRVQMSLSGWEPVRLGDGFAPMRVARPD